MNRMNSARNRSLEEKALKLGEFDRAQFFRLVARVTGRRGPVTTRPRLQAGQGGGVLTSQDSRLQKHEQDQQKKQGQPERGRERVG